MHIFYTPDIAGNQYTLSEEESKHCSRVLRLNKNDIIWLIDGRGGFYKAIISDNLSKRCEVKILEIFPEYEKQNYYLHIAIAPTKSIDRFEWFVEKATEIGITEISPIICEHSERKVVKTERLEKIAISAIKQSVKAYKPKINEAVNFNNFIIRQQYAETGKYIAHCMNSEKKELYEIYPKGQHAILLIGPEGDFSSKEIDLALKYSFQSVSLGKNRLRTETAGIVACHTLSLLNQ
ncbi:MAG: 16S rRNA (uracil(1498)-N(3))-methyltransferase [Bacteroidales bacterium]|nr:16S rRNA (uracil(1498)-N(3))-methyltransferase [Bacteroidales bacterium]